MKIALAQLNYTVGDVAGNTNKIIESVRLSLIHILSDMARTKSPTARIAKRIMINQVGMVTEI